MESETFRGPLLNSTATLREEKIEMNYMNSVSCLGLTLSVIGLLSLVASGPGYRLGWWPYKTGITLVKYAGFISVAAVVVCLVGLALWHWEVTSQGQTDRKSVV